MAKYPNKLVKFNTFNIIELISDATDIDISPIRQIDISISTITDIEINYIAIRSEDLDDYRYEIVSNRRAIDINIDCIVNIYFNIDFNNREVNNNSNCEIISDKYRAYNYNRKTSIINISIRKISIVSIIKRKRERNNKSIYAYERVYSKYGIYNCKRGARIASINKRKRESNNKTIDACAIVYINYEIYNYERGATTIHPRRR